VCDLPWQSISIFDRGGVTSERERVDKGDGEVGSEGVGGKGEEKKKRGRGGEREIEMKKWEGER
jgi:hypothetical protein